MELWRWAGSVSCNLLIEAAEPLKVTFLSEVPRIRSTTSYRGVGAVRIFIPPFSLPLTLSWRIINSLNIHGIL